MLTRRCLIAWIGLASLPFTARPRPASALVRDALRIYGPGVARELILDDATLAALGEEELATRTAWTDGTPRFGGVPLAKVLSAAGATGDRVHAIAVNDYAVAFSAKEVMADGAFLARTMNGRKMTLRDKGPFWLIFPWSQRPELETATVKSLALWQLGELEVL